MNFLSGKIALVTGAGQGVGQGIALALAHHGAKLALVGRTASKLVDTRKLIEKRGGTASTHECDVKDADSLSQTVRAVVDAAGGIDILVNNAQDAPLGTLFQVTDEAFSAGFVSGPLASFRLMKLCHPIMKARGGGVMVNLATSAATRWDSGGYGPYAAVKQATRALTRAATNEFGPDNIRVLSIAPVAMSPGMASWAEANPEAAAAYTGTIPLQRIGDCESDIGECVAALCSPMARYLTGATIPIDGGLANFD
jgi:NAD(P)-dependent dehydrogenase (short-subunit alcohol dehydrogenase family)